MSANYIMPLPKMRITTTAFIFHRGKLLLIKHKRTGKWLPVGGHLDEGETLDEALRREVREEVNLEIEFLEKFDHFPKTTAEDGFKELPKPFYIHAKDSSDRASRKMGFDFICRTTNIKSLKIQETEIDDYKWFSEKELDTFIELWKPIRILGKKAFKTHEEQFNPNHSMTT